MLFQAEVVASLEDLAKLTGNSRQYRFRGDRLNQAFKTATIDYFSSATQPWSNSYVVGDTGQLHILALVGLDQSTLAL